VLSAPSRRHPQQPTTKPIVIEYAYFISWAAARFVTRVGKKGIDAAAPIFFYFALPTFEFVHPRFSVLGGQKCNVAHPNH